MSLYTQGAAALLACTLTFAASALANSRAARPEAAPPDTAQPEFLAAMQRLKQHLPDSADSPQLQAYVIYDYLVAARLRRDLSASADERLDGRIQAFLLTHAGQPVSRALLHDWLGSLSQRERWGVFLSYSQDVTDPVLSCERLAARLASSDTENLAAESLARWSLPQKPPPPCAPVFAWLHQRGLITPALAESRTRAALLADNARLAREFAADIPAPEAIAYLRWSDLLEAPKSALNVLATHPTLPIDAEALEAAFDKLARQDVPTALALLPALLAREGTTPVSRAHLKRSAALGAAYDRDPRAVAAFEDLPADVLDIQVQEWRVRAALWAGDFAQASTWIAAMPQDLAAQPRWRYWQAAALAATEGAQAAEPLYAAIAQLRDYYGYLAAEHLHQAYQLNAHASLDDTAVQNALATEPGMMRARALFDCDLSDEANAEWNAAIGKAGNALKVQAAHLASRWGWYTQAITTLAQSGEFDDVDLRYPRPFLAEVDAGAKLAQLSPDWILAVMRQESLFRKDAVSRADARGVMQLLPATASAVARRWHLAPPSRDALFDPKVAVPLGAAYLRELLDKYAGNLPLALAAYNAGPAAADRWIPLKPMEPDIWIENIPYNETRGYIQHIVEHIVAFAYERGVEPPRLTELLRSLEPPAPAL
jgi:soluble lytic murein transglycosylase